MHTLEKLCSHHIARTSISQESGRAMTLCFLPKRRPHGQAHLGNFTCCIFLLEIPNLTWKREATFLIKDSVCANHLFLSYVTSPSASSPLKWVVYVKPVSAVSMWAGSLLLPWFPPVSGHLQHAGMRTDDCVRGGGGGATLQSPLRTSDRWLGKGGFSISCGLHST